jgi:hypothetical protein
MSAKKLGVLGEPLVVHLASVLRSVPKDVESFREKYRGWLEEGERIRPVYRLPRQAIIGLTRPSAGRRPILNENAAEIEMAFTDLCGPFKAIGYWKGQFIQSGCLVRPDPLPGKREQAQLGWTPSQTAWAKRLVERTDASSLRLKGYMGWLVTDPDFCEARDELVSQWNAMDEKQRPFPIERSVQSDSSSQGDRTAGKAVAEYQVQLNAFLDRWGLMGMPTWDLPHPQGPMFPTSLPSDAPSIPQHGLHLVLPIHYPLTGTDELLRQLRQQQVQLARENGLDPSMAGLPHFEAYGQMLEVDLLEMTIISRHGTPRPRGFVTVMEHAIAETLDLSVNQVQRLRKGISSCRRGKRSSVPWLRTDAS